MGGTAGTKTPRLNHASIQTSAYGVAIATGWGTFRAAVNLLWMGKLSSKTVKQNSGGGKGGQQPKTYEYFASVLMGACKGPIVGVSEVFKDQSHFVDGSLHTRLSGIAAALTAAGNTAMAADYSTLASQAAALNSGGQTALQQAGLSLATGNLGQSPQFFLSGNEQLGYSGTAYVYAQNYPLSGNATLPNHTLAVTSTTRATVGAATLDDAQPADILPSFLSLVPSWPSSMLADLTEYRTACQAYGFFLSPVLDAQRTASEFLDDLMTASNAAAFWSEGKLKVRPYADTAKTANGATFTPDLTPIYSLTDNDFLKSNDGDPVRIELTAPAEAYNYVQVEYSDRTHQYNTAIMPASDQASIDQFGLRKEDPVSMRCVSLPSVATVLAQVRLQRTCNMRQTFNFDLPESYCLLEPMDLVEITDARLGLFEKLVRITAIAEDEKTGELNITAEEMLVGASSPPLISRQAPLAVVSNYDVAPGDVSPPIMFNPPASITTGGGYEAWVAVSGGINWGGAEVWVSFDGTNYDRQGVISGGARYGVLTATLPVGSDPDNVHALKVDLSASGGNLLSTSTTAADAAGTLCRVGNELVAYETATLTGANAYDLTYLRRGVNQTEIASHPAGTDFIRLDDGLFKFPYTAAQKGQTMYVKFLSFNIFGRALQQLADVDPYDFVLDPDQTAVPAPAPGSWTLSAAAADETGLAGASMRLTGACDFPLAKAISISYRQPGSSFTEWGTFPKDTTVVTINPVIENGYYEVAVAYENPWKPGIGPALIVTNGASTLQPLVLEVLDGEHIDFVPPLSGIPTIDVDMSECLPPDAGETALYRITNLTNAGFDIALKNSDSSETTDHVTTIGTVVGGHFEAVKPTAADAYNGKYKFTVQVSRQQPASSAPIYSFSPLYARAEGATDWTRVGEVGGTGNTLTQYTSFAIDTHVVVIDIAFALGSSGATQFRAFNTGSVGSVQSLKVEYDTEVSAATEVSATDSSHKAIVTVKPPGYTPGGTTTGISFDNTAVATLPKLPSSAVPAADIVGYYSGSRYRIGVEDLPIGGGGGGGGGDAYAASNIDTQGNDEAGFNTALASAKLYGQPLTGNKGTVTIAFKKDMTGCHIHLPFKSITFGTNIGASTGMTTQAYNGVDVVGPVLELGASPLSPNHYEKLLRIVGGYAGDGLNQSTPCTAVRIKDDQASRSSYDIGLQNHRGDGLEINSDTEKKIINYRFQNLYQGTALTFRSLNNLSPDEVVVKLTGTLCTNLVHAQDGGQFSYRVEFDVENIKPWMDGGRTYAIDDASRKGTCYAGEIRSVDGDLLKIETRISGNSGGGPTAVFDNLRIIQHFCGRITIVNPKSVGGTIYHDQVDNTREAVKTTAYRNSLTSGLDMHLTRAARQPGFQIGAVLENCTLTYVTRRNVCPIGAQIGLPGWVNPTVPNGSSFDGKTIRLEIEMGDSNGPDTIVGSFSGTTLSVPKPAGEARPVLTVGQFLRAPGLPYWLRVVTAPSTTALNALPDGTPATYTVNQAVTTGLITIDATAPADMFTAFSAALGDTSTIDASGNLAGNILIRGGWQRGTIHVSAAWVRAGYTVEIDTTEGTPTTDFIIHGPMDFAEVTAIPWAFKGCKVLTVNDFEGAGAYFTGTKWVPMAPPKVPVLALQSMGSPVNGAKIKQAGLSVTRTDLGLPYWSTGNDAGSAWVTLDNTTITPQWDAATTNFESRTGGFSTAYKLAFDRFIYDLRLAGVYTGDLSTSKMKGFWPLMGPSELAAKNNLLFDCWDLDVYWMDRQEPGVGFIPYQELDRFPALEVLDWPDDDFKFGTSGHNLMFLASCGVLLNSAQSGDPAGGPFFTAGGNFDGLRMTFHRLDGGNHAQMNAVEGSRVIAPSQSNSGMDYRIGMAWTPNSTSQSIRMFGGPTVTGSKTGVSSPSTRLWFGHAYEYYLRIPIELAGLGSGNFTDDEAAATLTAVNTLRSTLLALA